VLAFDDFPHRSCVRVRVCISATYVFFLFLCSVPHADYLNKTKLSECSVPHALH
jgi:hypothetical protein